METALSGNLSSDSRARVERHLAHRLKELRAIRVLTQTRLVKKVDLLCNEDHKAFLVVLDSLLKRSKTSRVMAE